VLFVFDLEKLRLLKEKVFENAIKWFDNNNIDLYV